MRDCYGGVLRLLFPNCMLLVCFWLLPQWQQLLPLSDRHQRLSFLLQLYFLLVLLERILLQLIGCISVPPLRVIHARVRLLPLILNLRYLQIRLLQDWFGLFPLFRPQLHDLLQHQLSSVLQRILPSLFRQLQNLRKQVHRLRHVQHNCLSCLPNWLYFGLRQLQQML